MSGDWITDALATDSDYWVRHVRNPVLFSHAFKTLMSEEHQHYIFLEVGPGRSLESAAKQHFKADESALIYSSLPTAKDVELTGEYLLTSLGCLWASGVTISWAQFYGDEHRRRLPLPGYPFERKEFKLPALKRGAEGGQSASSVSALKRKKRILANGFTCRPGNAPFPPGSWQVAASIQTRNVGCCSWTPWLSPNIFKGSWRKAHSAY